MEDKRRFDPLLAGLELDLWFTQPSLVLSTPIAVLKDLSQGDRSPPFVTVPLKLKTVGLDPRILSVQRVSSPAEALARLWGPFSWANPLLFPVQSGSSSSS